MATNPTRLRRHQSRHIVAWAGDDMAKPGYGGMVVVVPPRHEIANPAAPASQYRFQAASDQDGAIPGTVILESVIVHDSNMGGFRAEFDATEWCDGIETTEFGKGLIARGMTILDGNATRAEIEAAQKTGRPKWEAAQEAQWNQVLAAEMTRRDKLKAQNRPLSAAPNEKAIRDAIAGLEMLRVSRVEKMVPDDAIRGALGFDRPAPAPATVTPFPTPVATTEPKDKGLDGLAEQLLAIAQKHNVRLKNDEVMGLVKRDEAVMIAVQTKLTDAGVDLHAEVGADA